MQYPTLTARRFDHRQAAGPRANGYNNSMPHSEPPQPAATPRHFNWRLLLQYRLRTLLGLMTIVAVWFALWSHTARRPREAVAVLRKVRSEINVAKMSGRVLR